MKIKVYFRGKEIPNSIYNRFGQSYVDVDSASVDEGVLLIKDSSGNTAINMAIVAAIDNPVEK